MGMLRALFSSSMTAEELLDAARAWRAFGSYAVWCGVIGICIGVILILRNLDDPSAIGPPMAIVILTTMYGCMAQVFAKACADRIQGRGEDLKG